MRIPLALLADHALAHPTDGKLYVTGGGITSLAFSVFPARHSHLALALGIDVSAGELGVEHRLTVETSGPTGEPFFEPVRVTFSVPRGGQLGDEGRVHFVSNMDNILLAGPGEYAFLITIDDLRIG